MALFTVRIYRNGALVAGGNKIVAHDAIGALAQMKVKGPLSLAGEPEQLVAQVREAPKGEWQNFFASSRPSRKPARS